MEASEFIGKMVSGSISDAMDEAAKSLLAERIGEDIKQYAEGDDKPKVVVDGDDAFIEWDGYRMPSFDFYPCVFKGNGVVTKELFKENAKKIAEE